MGWLFGKNIVRKICGKKQNDPIKVKAIPALDLWFLKTSNYVELNCFELN